ncbi:MAG: hypothetical protein Q9194_000009 [Teloschistes cf. exilis]
MPRKKPNIIVTGTPGVGKTTLCESLTLSTNLKHLAINGVVKERNCHHEWDEQLKSWIVDEDKLLDAIEDEVKQGGYLIDWHACDPFPESWIDLVVVLRSDSATLYDRLKSRNYSERKLQENLDAEIMEVSINEARDAFDAEIVIELLSNTTGDMEGNASRVELWMQQWKQQHGSEAAQEDRGSQAQILGEPSTRRASP